MNFKAHPLLFSGDLQTLGSHGIYRKHSKPHFLKAKKTEVIHQVKLDDGDVITLHEDSPEELDPEKTRINVVFVHGLGSNCYEPAILNQAFEARKLGARTFRVNHRGVASGKGLSKSVYHAGRTEDLHAVFQFVKDKYPDLPLVVAAYSLSANMLLLYGGLGKGEGLIDYALTFCPVMDLKSGALGYHRRLLGLYNKVILSRIKKYLVEQRENITPILGDVDIESVKSMLELDEKLVSKAAGFNSCDEYFASCSSLAKLNNIPFKVFLLQALNDPLADGSALQVDNLPSQIDLLQTKNGGHLGYISRRKTPLGNPLWMDWVFQEKFKEFVGGYSA